jgi:MFS family permease
MLGKCRDRQGLGVNRTWLKALRSFRIFDPVVFLRPVMVGIAVLLAAVSVGYWAMLVYLAPFLAAALGVSTGTGGIVMLAATLPMLCVPPLGGRIVIALGWRWHFALALAIMTIGSAGFVVALTANATPNQWLVILAMIVVGLGAALAHPQLSGAVVALVPAEQAGMASAVTIVMRQAGFAVGIAVLGALLGTPDQAAAYVAPFVAAAAACGLGVLASLVLLPPKPHGADLHSKTAGR